MINLKDIIESVEQDEVLVLSKSIIFDQTVDLLHGNSTVNNPTSFEGISYQKFKLNNFNARKIEEHINYLQMASIKSRRSYCKRRQVGALLVKENNILAEGYNGTPKGFDNNCEDCNGETQWFVQHAEANAITKMSKSTQSSAGATLYNTLCPCKECSKLLLGAEISAVFFNETYKTLDGLEMLIKSGMKIYYIPKKLF